MEFRQQLVPATAYEKIFRAEERRTIKVQQDDQADPRCGKKDQGTWSARPFPCGIHLTATRESVYNGTDSNKAKSFLGGADLSLIFLQAAATSCDGQASHGSDSQGCHHLCAAGTCTCRSRSGHWSCFFGNQEHGRLSDVDWHISDQETRSHIQWSEGWLWPDELILVLLRLWKEIYIVYEPFHGIGYNHGGKLVAI